MRNVRETIRERSTVMVRICNKKRRGRSCGKVNTDDGCQWKLGEKTTTVIEICYTKNMTERVIQKEGTRYGKNSKKEYV